MIIAPPNESCNNKNSSSGLAPLFLICCSIFIAYLALVFLRNDGINCDEGFYLSCTSYNPFCDSVQLGKPPLFYAFNYLLFRSFELVMPGRSSLLLLAFYALMVTISVGYVTASVPSTTKRRSLNALILALSPMLYFHATHLMMESLVIVLLNFFFACLLSLSRKDKLPTKILLAIIICLTVCVKETALPAIVVILSGYPQLVKQQRVLLGSSLLVSLLLRFLSLWMLDAQLVHQYTGGSLFFNFSCG